jgi:hypothetical protein
LRSILTTIFVAALVAAPAQSKAAPRSIGDCEQIQAADAYNQGPWPAATALPETASTRTGKTLRRQLRPAVPKLLP